MMRSLADINVAAPDVVATPTAVYGIEESKAREEDNITGKN